MKKAFTLAEVLITLGIIGIVAAMTMPTLIGKYRKSVVENRLKSTYSQVANVLQLINVQNSMAFIPDVSAEAGENGWSYDYSKAVFEKYFAPDLKIIKKLDSDKRFEICNYKGEGCYKNPSYTCVLLANGVGLCTAVNGNSGSIAFQVIINPNRQKLYAGRDAFAFGVERNLTANNYNMSLSLSPTKYYSEQKRNSFINNCISNNAFPSEVGPGTIDREYFCTFLIYNNGWKVPDDYPIQF